MSKTKSNTPGQRILVLFAHPAIQRSKTNRILADEIRNLPGVTFRDLYEEYPDLMIDMKREQEFLVNHDVVVFQHPFYWYSTPAILKEWMDITLEYGFAYGESGTKLAGKKWVHAITTGGAEDAYAKNGSNRFTIRQLMAPIEQSAFLCGMDFLPPFILHGVSQFDARSDHPKVRSAYRKFIEGLRDGHFHEHPAGAHP